jgi:hypothetical protein
MHGLQRRGDGVAMIAINLFSRLGGGLSNIYRYGEYK